MRRFGRAVIATALCAPIAALPQPRAVDLRHADRVAALWVRAAQACGDRESVDNMVVCDWRNKPGRDLAHQANMAIAGFFVDCSYVMDENGCNSIMSAALTKQRFPADR